MYRQLSLGGVGVGVACVLAAFLGSANAADMLFKAPQSEAAPSWTGFYIGVNGGAGLATAASSISDFGILGVGGIGAFGNLPVASHELNGFLAGGQVGYNWQTGNIVLGVEGDGDWSNVQGTAPCVEVISCSDTVNWTADATARVGILPTSNMLIYVKGGAAWVGENHTLSASVGGTALNGSLTTTKTGGLVGIGTEYLFAPHWTAKIEYNYADYGSHTDTMTLSDAGATASIPVQTSLQMHTVKAGVNYHF